jgi:predicted transcriptional regulator
MQINFTPDQEAELSQAALHNGTGAEELVQELALHFLHDQARFREGVRRGIEAADRGDFVDTAQLWAEVEQTPQA